MRNTYDAIVLGAGALGSAAAYHLAKAGQQVLLLEQFEIDHQKGSSYGFSRIIRYAYDHPVYVELMKSAYPAWASLEEETGEILYTRTGGLDFGTHNETSLQAVIQCLSQTGIPHEILNAEEIHKRFPQFHLDEDFIALYQADTGILSASKCVKAHVQLAEKHGAKILPNTPILEVTAHSDGVSVKTARNTYQAARLIITAGSWMKSVLAGLGLNVPLEPERCQEIYFNTHNPENYGSDRFPAFIAHLKDQYGQMPYGIASHQDSGLKVAFHGGKRVNHPVDYTPDPAEVERAQQFTKRHLPDATSLRSTRICLYTMTPDEHFLLDKHPAYSHIVFAGGCSGHAFKFSNLIGSILTDLALNGTTKHDISLFNVSRFL